jgi:methyl-accepting chemotaxis protein
MSMSLRSRIALVATVLVLAAIAVNTLLQTFAARQAVLEQVRVGGESIAETLARAAAFAELRENVELQDFVNELVAGDVREVRILDPQMKSLVTRRIDAAGMASNAEVPLLSSDAVLIRDCVAGNRPVGRFETGLYRAAAPVRSSDGRAAGAVLVTISTDSSRSVLWWQAAAAAASAVFVGLPGVLAALWFANSIAQPVRRALVVAESIAAGDLTGSVPQGGEHEVGRLLGAFGRMTGSLGGLIGRIQSAGERLSTVEEKAATALVRQDRSVRTFSDTATEISAAINRISATSEDLLGATSEVTEVAREAARVADQGRGGLEGMTASMQQLDEAMNAFTRKLSTISQRASGITAVVTTIAKVADQTNLLSVNATIEAEKAGESGRGFRIVAQEIRRLADQTALATKDIERMVRDLQAAVSGGTMEMDRFRNEVSVRIGEVSTISEQLGRIIEPVQSVTHSLESVHEGMRAQSQGARQIRDAMETLRGGAGESAASVAVFSSALDELRRSIAELNAETARFKTEPQGQG